MLNLNDLLTPKKLGSDVTTLVDIVSMLTHDSPNVKDTYLIVNVLLKLGRSRGMTMTDLTTHVNPEYTREIVKLTEPEWSIDSCQRRLVRNLLGYLPKAYEGTLQTWMIRDLITDAAILFHALNGDFDNDED